MPTRKIADLPTPRVTKARQECLSPDHDPPKYQVFEPGQYLHTCSKCHRQVTFTVQKTYWL